MNRVVLILVAAFISTSAQAEWTLINDFDGDIYYVDRETITRKGPILKYWMLNQLKQPQPSMSKGVPKSVKTLVNINCDEETSKFANMIFTDGDMGAGTILLSKNLANDPMEPSAPDSIFGWLTRVGCKNQQ